MAPRFTYVLIHGAFTDASSWWPITIRMLGAGQNVLVPPVQMQSFAADCDYIRSVVDGIEGDVILVGHGYGAAIAGAAGSSPAVRGLVFISGYVLDRGETLTDLSTRFPCAEIAPHLVGAPVGASAGHPCAEISVDIHQFPFYVADGLSEDEAGVLSVSQRPVAAAVITEAAVDAAWHDTASWCIVTAADRVVPPPLQRFGYVRAGARRILEIDAPHLAMRTHPAQIVDFLLDVGADVDDDRHPTAER